MVPAPRSGAVRNRGGCRARHAANAIRSVSLADGERREVAGHPRCAEGLARQGGNVSGRSP